MEIVNDLVELEDGARFSKVVTTLIYAATMIYCMQRFGELVRKPYPQYRQIELIRYQHQNSAMPS